MTNRSHPLIRFFTHPTTCAVIVLSILWVIFFWRLWTPTAADRVVFQKGDFPLHYYSYSDYQVERMSRFEIPLWNPYNYGGDPFAANVQWAVWYPPRWIAAVLAGGASGWGIEALQLEVAAHYWLISLMMYAFLRVLFPGPRRARADDELDWSAFPALFGAILWTYGGYLVGYPMLQASILESVAWLPLMMLGAHLSVTDPRWRVRGMLLAGSMMALSIFGGHTQTTMQMTYFTGAYIAFLGWRDAVPWRGIAWRIVLLGASGAVLAAIQLIPALELTRLSYRAETYHYAEKATGYITPELAQVIWPHLFSAEYWPLYLGVVGLLLAILAIRRAPRQHAFWIGTIIVSLWLALGGYSMVYDVFYVLVPGVNTFREQERAAALAMFALVVLVADQVAFWIKQRADTPDEPASSLITPWVHRLGYAHLALTTLVYLVVTLIMNVTHDHAITPEMANAVGLVALVSLLFNGWLIWFPHEHRPTRVWGALLLIAVVDLFSFGMHSPNFLEDNAFNRIQPPDYLDVLQQPIEDIAWHMDGAAGIQSYGTYWRIPDIYGTGPFRLASIEKLRQIRVDRRWEVLAVRYATMIADTPDNVPVNALGEGVNYDGQAYTLYELTDPRPIAHLVYDARQFDSPDAARAFMIEEPYITLREVALVADPLPFTLPGQRPDDPLANTVQVFHMTLPEYIEMQVSTEANALLTVAIADYPGWQATVNGRKVDIVDTYGGLIGIPVAPGANQRVVLEFKPPSVMIGAIISALAWLALGGYVIVVAIRHWSRARQR